MKKRVFILTCESPNLAGGVEHLVRELAEGLGARGYGVEIFHRENSLPRWLKSFSGQTGRKISGNLLGAYVGMHAQERMDDDVVAVISNSDVGYYPLKSSNGSFKLIHFYHGTYRGQAEAIRHLITYPGYLYLKWLNSMITERWSGRGKLVLCNSEQTREEVAHFFGIDGLAVYLPMDTTNFRVLDPKQCRREIELPESGPVGLFAGNISPMKNFALVQRLIDSLDDIQWLLVLRGDVPLHLKRRPHVRIFQDASHRELPVIYGAADFAVFPSLYEPFGYVVAEALACGTPAIASRGGASQLFLQQPILDRLLISAPDAFDEFLSVARGVLREPDLYRRAVIEFARPRVEAWMAPQNWWQRFFEVTGL
jgi:glycosyltransferase involved in cell wall biosynthesis